MINKYKVKSRSIIISGILPGIKAENIIYDKAFSANNRLVKLQSRWCCIYKSVGPILQPAHSIPERWTSSTKSSRFGLAWTTLKQSGFPFTNKKMRSRYKHYRQHKISFTHSSPSIHNGIKVCYLNACSVSIFFQDLEEIVCIEQYDFIGVTESWIGTIVFFFG